MRKIYLGFERSDFDLRILKTISKANGSYLSKLLFYYLLSMDWLSSEDVLPLKKDLSQKLTRILDVKKTLFGTEKECFLHQLNVTIIEYILSFLEDRSLIQRLHFKQHNFTNIAAFISNCTCEFKGLVYLIIRVEKEIKALKFLLNFDYKFRNLVDCEVLIRFLKCVLIKEYAFLDELLKSFRKKYETIKNDILLMEFYDCYSEFLGCSKLLKEIYQDFKWYFDQKKVPKIQLMFVNHEQDSEMEKTLFLLKKNSNSNFIDTKISEMR